MQITPLLSYCEGVRPLVFSPANGFPPCVYQTLLQQLSPHYQIWLAEHRPLWQGIGLPPKRLDWRLLAADLRQQIEQQQLPPVTLVGHSLGAILGLMAAIEQPELFDRIILIEPVCFPAFDAQLLKWLPWSVTKQLPIVAKTLKRPTHFKNKRTAFDFHRKARAFSKMSDLALQHYIDFGFDHGADGSCELRYSKHWEAAVYASLPNVWSLLKQVRVPVIGFRAEYSTTLKQKEWLHWQRLRADHQLRSFAGACHLLPLTEPEQVAQEILALDAVLR